MAKKHKKESFSKKSAKKFGGYIKSPYLCTRKSEIDRCSLTTDQKVVGLNPAGITKSKEIASKVLL